MDAKEIRLPPEWDEWLQSYKKASSLGPHNSRELLFDEIQKHPIEIQVTVALGLSLVKWSQQLNLEPADERGSDCGCCIYVAGTGCSRCPLSYSNSGHFCIEGSTPVDVFNNILISYIKYYDLLPEEWQDPRWEAEKVRRTKG